MVKNEKIEKLLAECEVLFDSKRKNIAEGNYGIYIISIVSHMNNYTRYNWYDLSDIFNYEDLCVKLYYSYRLAKYLYTDNKNIQINNICNDIINRVNSSDSEVKNVKVLLKSSINDFINNFDKNILSLDDGTDFNYKYSDLEISIMKEKCDPIVNFIDKNGYILKPNKKVIQNINNNFQNIIPLSVNEVNESKQQYKSSMIIKEKDEFINISKTVIDYLDKTSKNESSYICFLALVGNAYLKDNEIISIIKQNDNINNIISNYFGDEIFKSFENFTILKEDYLRQKISRINNEQIIDSFIKLIYSLDDGKYIAPFMLLLNKNQYLSKDIITIDNNDIRVEQQPKVEQQVEQQPKVEQQEQQPKVEQQVEQQPKVEQQVEQQPKVEQQEQQPKVEQQEQQPQWTNPITPEEEEMIKKAKVFKQQDQQKQQPVQQEQKEPESYSLMDAINSTTLGRKLFQKIDNIAV